MTNIKSGILARFHAPIIRLALSLCAALGIASAAQADDMLYWWEGETIFDEMVSTNGSVWVGSSEVGVFAENWHVWKSDDGSLDKGITQTAWSNIRVADLENNKGRLKIESGLYHAMNDIIVGGGSNCDAHLWVAGGRFESLYWMTVGGGQSSNATVAVTGGELYVGTADNGSTVVLGSGASASASLSVSGTGSFTCNTMNMAEGAGAQATFTVDGGTATVAAINRAGTDEAHGTATVQLKNGTLVSTTAADGDFIPAANGLSVEVTGGTINNANNISIGAAITGAGWLTKTGAGTLRLSNVAGFTGRITVAENAGSVIIPATATNIKVGAYTAKEITEDEIVFTHSDTDLSGDNHWTGKGASNEWSAPGNWDTGLEGANNYVIRSNEMNGEPVTVEFAAANSISTSLWIENLLSGVVTFSSDAGGLETAGLTVGTGTSGALAIASGAYSSSWVNIGTGGGSASFTMESGSLASAGDFNVAITGATSEFTQNGGTITSGANGWWGADNSKAVADINDGSISFTGNLNLLNQNDTGDAASYITNNIAGGSLAANEIWFLGKAGHATVNLSSGTIETGKFGVNGSGIYAINISGGTLKAAADGTFIPASDKLTVTVDGNATLNTNGKTITIDAAMLGDGTLTCVGSGTVTFTSLDSTCNIVANGATVNQPQAYYWIGGAAGEWNDGSNWSLSADGDAANEYPNTVSDTVVIGTPATITLTDNVVVREVVVTADVVFSGEKSLGFATMRGEGLVTMSNVTFTNTSEDLTPFVIFNNICLAKGSDNTLDGADLANYVYGDISGSGNITVKYKHSGDNDKGGTHFCGDNSGFAGTLTFSRDSGSYSRLWLDGGAASSENAIWQNLYCYAPSGNAYMGSTYLMTPNESYKFGGIQGGVFYGSSDVTIEIGAREDFNSAFELKTHGSRPRGYITKVGSGVLTLNGFPYVLTLKGGTTYLGGSFGFADYSGRSSYVTFAGEGATLAFSGYTGDPSGRIKNSTSAIIFDDGGADYIWATALAASNVGGLTKNGSGTLTLATLPAYRGPTKVLAGKLVVPFGTKFESLTLEGDASVDVDMTEAVPNAVAFSSGKFTGDASKVTLVNSPDGYTVQSMGSADNIIYGNGSTTYTWQGPTSTFVNEVETSDYAWETETNWTPNGVPGSLDVVVFGTAAPKFTLASDVAVMSVIVNGEGGFSYAADHALTVIGNFSVAAAGTLEISGAGSLEVNGVVSGVTDVTMTPQPATSGIIAAHPYYTEKFRSSYDLNLTALTGGGTIQSIVDQSVTVAQNTTSTFYGTLTGAMGLTKSGDGTLELQGPNSFTGGIAINAGVIKLGNVLDSLKNNCRYQFTADHTNNFTFAEGSNTQISKLKGSYGETLTFDSGNYAEYVEGNNDYFDGKPYISFNAGQYSPSSKHYSQSSIFVYQKNEAASGDECLGYYKSGSNIDYFYVRGDNWYLNNNGTQNAWGLFSDGMHSTTFTVGKKSVVSINKWMVSSANREDHIGTTFKGAVAEAWGFTKTLSLEERAAAESYLMQKWGCDDAIDHQILPKTADVTMKSGATLDMGGLTQTVTSFTGAGTVTNGYLKTTGDLTVDGGTLTIQATTGQTYVLSDVETERLVLTGDAKGYTIKVPENAKIVGRFVVPEGIKVGLEGEDGLDVTVHLGESQKGWEITGKPVAGGILYRVGSFPFVLKLR